MVRARGFSLVELLVVIGIGLLLAVLGTRMLGAGRQAAWEKEAEVFGKAVLAALEQAAAEGVYDSKGRLLEALPEGFTQDNRGASLNVSGARRLCERVGRLPDTRTRFPQAPSYVGCVVELETQTVSAGGMEASVSRFVVYTWVKDRGRRVYVAGR
ncbi:hypothetical protein CSW29_11855 [Thermus scotoductus]|uniref:Uncharacterized protein n=1 Tax=Thermus scotoductus TaxID=37636 RepID=A0A430UEB6_THESC|nr:type II secretion system protein [Thermus scotoductus]RTH97199.1 hypothetical protein CSW29_11855 [Thermus scotoductus]